MGYKQVDGVKPILVNEQGKVRNGLRTLPPDHDRFIYEYDKQTGKRKNVWPWVIVSVSGEGRKDKRLLPELVMKEHGDLPRKVKCSPEDFKARDGNRLNCELENIEYKPGQAEKSPDSAYVDPPNEEEKKPKKKSASKEHVPSDPSKPDPKKAKPEVPMENIGSKSQDMTAKDAISLIGKYNFDELMDMEFLSDDEDRVTVQEAWEKKKRAFEEEQ